MRMWEKREAGCRNGRGAEGGRTKIRTSPPSRKRSGGREQMREPAWERIDALAIRAFEEVRVRPTFLPSALLRKPRREWGCQPGLVGKAVNQMPIFRDVLGEASIRYGKLLTRLTGSRKARKLAIIQAFCASRDSGNDGQRRGAEAKTCSRAAPALRLSLPHRHLVNSRSDWGCARLRSSAMPFAVGAYITFSSACPLAG